MTDQEDVRTRVDDALRRAAALAYEAAHGAIDEDPGDSGPTRWRILVRPRVVVTVVLAAAVLAALLMYGPWGARARPASFAAAPTAVASADAATTPWEGGEEGLPGTGGPAGAGEVVVDVVGAVERPGVVTLDQGARVVDAIDAAGGAAEGADLDALNLARLLVDGEQVRVPLEGEAPAAGAASGSSGGLVNINQADAAALEALPGVGPVLAGRIVTYRDTHGPFASVDALDAVSGVGPAVLAGLADSATV